MINLNIPRQEIELISKGKVYNNIPSIIEIENMVTRDEDTLHSNGKVENDVFKILVQNKIKTPNVDVHQLLIGDFNQLLIKIRCSAYGDKYKIKAFDTDIEDYVEHVIDMTKLDFKPLGDDYNENGQFSIVLPVSGYKVNFILPTVGLSEVINKVAESKENKTTGEIPYITTKLEYIIQSIEDETNRDIIKQYASIMSPIDRLAITKKMEEVEPNILLKAKLKTVKTQTDYETDFLLGLDFFYPEN